MSSTDAGFSIDNFSEAAVKEFAPDERKSLANLVNELCRIEYGRLSFGIEGTPFLELLIKSLKESTNENIPFSETDYPILQSRLADVIGQIKSINIVAKAFGIFIEHCRTFSTAKILTDIRPVFTDDAKTIQAATIIHNLVISYVEGGEKKDFHVALDTEDISELRRTVDRADIKSETTRAFVSSSKIPYITAGS